MRASVSVLLLLMTLLFACERPSPDEPPLRPGCNPLGGDTDRGPGGCLYPFPADVFTRPDPTSRTGLRLSLPTAALPVSQTTERRIDATIYDRRDGWSSAGSLYVAFPVALDKAQLPGPGRQDSTLRPDSPIGILREDSGERVALFAELDVNAEDDGSLPLLLLHPTGRLRPGTRYLVYVRGLRDAAGQLAAPLPGFAALRDEALRPDSPRQAARPRQAEVLSRLAAFGVQKDELQLAWDFTTGSDEALHERLLSMRDAAFADLDAQPPAAPIAITESLIDPPERPATQRLLRRLLGTFTAPTFLAATGEEGGPPRLLRGPDGEPKLRGREPFPLAIHVPECVTGAPGPVPVLLYGHGTFNTGASELDTAVQRELGNRLCVVQVGFDWLGLALSDAPYFYARASQDWNAFPVHAERLQQAHVNLAVLARLIRRGALDAMPELQRMGGQPLFDRNQVYFFGISEGGIQGATALAVSPDISRGALHVGCGFWSFYMWRSTDGTRFLPVLAGGGYPDAADRQALLAIGQLEYDFTDPAHFGGHLLRDPLRGVTTKPVLYHEGLGDAAVPNLATRRMVRVIGLPLLSPGSEPLSDVPLATAPQGSAYVQFDVGVQPRPGATNRPPAENPVHEAIRRLDAAQEQLRRFLRTDGRVEDTCMNRPCAFAPPGPAH
jgi:hypothetical protein